MYLWIDFFYIIIRSPRAVTAIAKLSFNISSSLLVEVFLPCWHMLGQSKRNYVSMVQQAGYIFLAD
eukprot:snap_masked-scaffold_8-processed-gene-14.82-mRNA-1 protein AED:1.00 eAED:1.00 QI:0/0/0/0/1/1/2/0/65